MRLLNVSTHQFSEFNETNTPPYIIASHRWTSDETTFKDIKKSRNTQTTGYQKVLSFCSLVQQLNVPNTRAFSILGVERNCQWLWIDTACIDKSSSAEVSESINSMFQWYQRAEVCYAFLQDVGSVSSVGRESAVMDFMQSEWFRRGWTLQELLAPRVVVFLTRDWEVLGHKCPLKDCDMTCRGFGEKMNTKLAKITGVPEMVLRECKISLYCSVEMRKGWAKDRITTKIEDRAYCLLGLFDVHLVPIYGEREDAWERLEEEIRKKVERMRRETPAILEDEFTSAPASFLPHVMPMVHWNENSANEYSRMVNGSFDNDPFGQLISNLTTSAPAAPMGHGLSKSSTIASPPLPPVDLSMFSLPESFTAYPDGQSSLPTTFPPEIPETPSGTLTRTTTLSSSNSTHVEQALPIAQLTRRTSKRRAGKAAAAMAVARTQMWRKRGTRRLSHGHLPMVRENSEVSFSGGGEEEDKTPRRAITVKHGASWRKKWLGGSRQGG